MVGEELARRAAIMSLSVASSEPHELSRDDVSCACEIEKARVVRAYIQACFPTCAIREFHSKSTVRYGNATILRADHHVISLSEDRPICAVLTSEFFEQPVEG